MSAATATAFAATDRLHDFVARHPRLFVLTGAGVSTDSGIPAYRNDLGEWQRQPPMTGQEFLRTPAARQRYWARSMRGWPHVANARPNGAHTALAALEASGRVARLVTQNVDGLHQRAGSADVIELHGNLGRVRCLDCRAEHSRAAVQQMLEAQNPQFAIANRDGDGVPAPDGDADFDASSFDAFRVPECPLCGGVLKPEVVFFGEGVPRDRVDNAFAALDGADAMLVVGSSLMVYSGYRFCERAAQLGKPIGAINRGRTRADALLALKVEAPGATVLSALVEVLERQRRSWPEPAATAAPMSRR